MAAAIAESSIPSGTGMFVCETGGRRTTAVRRTSAGAVAGGGGDKAVTDAGGVCWVADAVDGAVSGNSIGREEGCEGAAARMAGDADGAVAARASEPSVAAACRESGLMPRGLDCC